MAKGKLNLTGMDDLAEVLGKHDAGGSPVGDKIRLDRLVPDPNQPRKRFNQTKLLALCESIKAQGVLEPIVVRPADAAGVHLIIFGERRWRAATMAGLDEIPALIKDTATLSEKDVRLMQLVENIQRDDLDALEVAMTIKGLLDEGMKKAAIAVGLGESASYVTEHLALMEGPEFIRDLAAEGKAGLRTLYDLGKLYKDFPSEVEAYATTTEEITRAGVTELAARLKTPASSATASAGDANAPAATAQEQGTDSSTSSGESTSVAAGGDGTNETTAPVKPANNSAPADPNIASLEKELSDKLGTKVTISHGKNGGSMNIRYFTVDDLEGILNRIR